MKASYLLAALPLLAACNQPVPSGAELFPSVG